MKSTEVEFIRTFVISSKQDRWLTLAERRRSQFIRGLSDFKDLDQRFVFTVPAHTQSEEKLYHLLQSKGAPEYCDVISEDAELDGKRLLLGETLGQVVAYRTPSILICIPSILALYQAEAIRRTYLLNRRN